MPKSSFKVGTSALFTLLASWAFFLILPAGAQSTENATELLQKARAFGESTRTWRAEVVEKSQIFGPSMNVQTVVRTKIAAQAPLKISRQNSGDDQTILVCDGAEAFYSGDGHSYYKHEAGANPGCDLPLIKFYENYTSPDSASIIGEDSVRLRDGERHCVLIRAVWKQKTGSRVRTMCIDPSRPLILRDVIEAENETTGMRSVTSITFSDFEANPAFSPDTFRISIPPGAVEAKPPI